MNAADDEPVFVLRAEDVTAPGTVRAWVHYARSAGTPEAKCKQAEQVADDMERWQQKRGLRKVPD